MTAAPKRAVGERDYERRILPVVVSVEEGPPAADPLGEFLTVMRELAAGECLTPRSVHASYVNLARANRWPPITERRLTKALCARGCRKRRRDLRSAQADRERLMRRYGGKKRPIVIEFPDEFEQ